MRQNVAKRDSVLSAGMAAGCLGLLCLVLVGCRESPSGGAGGTGSIALPAPGSAPGIGELLPALNVEGWISIDGSAEGPDPAELEGRVIVVETWGFW